MTSHFIYCPHSYTFVPEVFPEALWQKAHGVMTTFVLTHPVFEVEAHFTRLQTGAQEQAIPLPWSSLHAWTQFIGSLDGVRPEGPCVVRVCVAQADLGAQSVWVSFRPVPVVTGPLTLSTCHYERPWPALKTLHDLAWAEMLRDLKATGFDEALRVNAQGHVAEAVYANVFGITPEGGLVTPAASTGCLLGTMRHAVITKAEKTGLSCLEVCEPVPYFEALPGLFLTNAVRGLMSVGQLNQTHYPVEPVNEVIAKLNLRLYDSSSFS